MWEWGRGNEHVGITEQCPGLSGPCLMGLEFAQAHATQHIWHIEMSALLFPSFLMLAALSSGFTWL